MTVPNATFLESPHHGFVESTHHVRETSPRCGTDGIPVEEYELLGYFTPQVGVQEYPLSVAGRTVPFGWISNTNSLNWYDPTFDPLLLRPSPPLFIPGVITRDCRPFGRWKIRTAFTLYHPVTPGGEWPNIAGAGVLNRYLFLVLLKQIEHLDVFKLIENDSGGIGSFYHCGNRFKTYAFVKRRSSPPTFASNDENATVSLGTSNSGDSSSPLSFKAPDAIRSAERWDLTNVVTEEIREFIIPPETEYCTFGWIPLLYWLQIPIGSLHVHYPGDATEGAWNVPGSAAEEDLGLTMNGGMLRGIPLFLINVKLIREPRLFAAFRVNRTTSFNRFEFFDLTVADQVGDGGEITSWLWNFGDAATSALQNPTHTYAAPGDYTVILTVTNAFGNTDTHSAVVHVPIVAEFTWAPVSPGTGEIVQFTDQSLPLAAVVSRLWNFGDGQTSAAQNPSHVYTTGGTKSVTLTVIDAEGNMSSVTHDVVVTQTLVANFTGAILFYDAFGVRVRFDSTSQGSITSYDWTASHGGPASGDGQPFIHWHFFYTSGGAPATGTITLQITGPAGSDLKTRDWHWDGNTWFLD